MRCAMRCVALRCLSSSVSLSFDLSARAEGCNTVMVMAHSPHLREGLASCQAVQAFTNS